MICAATISLFVCPASNNKHAGPGHRPDMLVACTTLLATSYLTTCGSCGQLNRQERHSLFNSLKAVKVPDQDSVIGPMLALASMINSLETSLDAWSHLKLGPFHMQCTVLLWCMKQLHCRYCTYMYSGIKIDNVLQFSIRPL